ncbi:MAG: TetR/AcrR family transcriptional regulator [Chloroflexota bacterium]
MGRWQPGARERLERAALELFVEQGFAETTVPQITARAGLTTRTFFRHFADKREVLFAGEDELPKLVARLTTETPASLDPMAALAFAVDSIAEAVFEGRRDYLRTRRAVINADEGLRERELRKGAVLSELVRKGFLDRGTDELTSTLAAHIAVTVFSVALNRWLDQERGFAEIAVEVQDALRLLVADSRPQHSEPSAPSHVRDASVTQD